MKKLITVLLLIICVNCGVIKQVKETDSKLSEVDSLNNDQINVKDLEIEIIQTVENTTNVSTEDKTDVNEKIEENAEAVQEILKNDDKYNAEIYNTQNNNNNNCKEKCNCDPCERNDKNYDDKYDYTTSKIDIRRTLNCQSVSRNELDIIFYNLNNFLKNIDRHSNLQLFVFYNNTFVKLKDETERKTFSIPYHYPLKYYYTNPPTRYEFFNPHK